MIFNSREIYSRTNYHLWLKSWQQKQQIFQHLLNSQDISVHDLCQRTSFSRPTANNSTRLAPVLLFLLYLTILFDVFGLGFYLDCAYIVYFLPCITFRWKHSPYSHCLYTLPFRKSKINLYYRFWCVFSPLRISLQKRPSIIVLPDFHLLQILPFLTNAIVWSNFFFLLTLPVTYSKVWL